MTARNDITGDEIKSYSTGKEFKGLSSKDYEVQVDSISAAKAILESYTNHGDVKYSEDYLKACYLQVKKDFKFIREILQDKR